MPERLKGILDRLKEFWGKLTTAQKGILISIVAAVVAALVIVGVVSSQETWVEAVTCENTTQSGQVKELLTENNYEYQVSDDGLTYKVLEENQADVAILLGENEIQSTTYDIDKVFDGSFSTTEADKSKKYQLYLEEKMSEQLASQDNVASATVTLSIPTDDGTLIAQDQDTYASVMLELEGDMEEEQAAGIATFVATAVGNDNTDCITVMDTTGNTLYAGGDSDSDSAIGTASDQLSYQEEAESLKRTEVSNVITGTNVYDNVNVGLNLVLNYENTEYTNHHYYVDEDQTQGYLDSRSEYSAETEGGSAAVPGTDSNDDTTYVTEDGETSSSTITDVTEDYLPSEEITNTESGITIDYDTSSVSVVATSYHIYNEDQMEEDGTLDEAGLTFDQFVEQNSARTQLEVDDELVDAVVKATGFTEENVSIVAYEVPFFQYSEGSGRTLTDYLEIILAILIFALLGFVVFRSTRKNKEEEEVQPELSVETLLESTKEAEEVLEDIDYTEKSETRLLIEKFVDENPEAVASLLRNWLED
ncbi:MAG: flagellar M-ring protein FliF [Eubacterium sp.]|nr:flagellar M-ring protein FliF [Eubacterium sp.]